MDSTSIIKNVLFVNSAVLSLDAYTNSETFKIGYDTQSSTTDEMMQCFLSAARDNNTINRIGFAFHYSTQILFLNQEPFFTDSDLGESVDIYSKNVQFMLDLLLLGGITHVDFLACNTLQNDKWKQYYQLLQTKTGVIIGASENNTGNLKYGGDWIMESTQEEVGLIYFTAEIENWASLLALPTGLNTYYHTFYTVQSGGTVMTRAIYNNAGTTILDTRDISFGGMPIADVFSLLDGGGTNPYTIGIVDSSLNKICMDIAYAGVYTKALTDRQKTVLMNDVNTKYKEPHTYMTVIYTVTVINDLFVFRNSANVVVSAPISLASGSVYLFDQSDITNSGNLIKLSSTSPSLTEIISGVTPNGTPGNLNAYTIIAPSSTLSVYGYLPVRVRFTVRVDLGEYWISTNGATEVRKPHLTFVSGTTYTFNQSHASNVGYPLQLTLHTGFPTTYAAYNNTSTPYTTGVVSDGTSVTISVNASTPTPLYYYCTNPGDISMGYLPPLAIIKYTFEVENGTVVANSGTAGANGNGTLSLRNDNVFPAITGTQTITYNAICKRGTKSLYNSTYSKVTSYVSVGSTNLSSTEMTYCFWIQATGIIHTSEFIPMSFERSENTNTPPRPMDLIIIKHNNTTYDHCFLNFDNTPTYSIYFDISTNQFNNTWKHLTITVNSNRLVSIYTDGVKKSNTFTVASFPENTAGFRIFSGAKGYTGMQGYIDDYRIYNTMLTDAEILSIYQNANYMF